MSEPVFLFAIVVGCGTVLMIVKTIAGAFAGNQTTSAEMDDLRNGYNALLEESRATQALHSTQIAELQDRVDFAERLLTQARDRDMLPPGDASR